MNNYPENIFEAIRTERQDFLYNYIEIVDGLLFNQYRTIKKIHKYYNSHYESGDYENVNGVQRKKVFYNINKWRAEVATKMIDVDVKDFLLISENYDTEWQTYLLERELKAWLKKHKLGKTLNEVVRKLPVYGSVVLKKVKGGADVVDLRTFMCDQAAESLDKSRYIMQKHLLSAEELRGMVGVWDNVDEVIDKFCNYTNKGSYEDLNTLNQPQTSPYAEIYERWAQVPRNWLTNGGYGDTDTNDWVLAHFIVAGVDAGSFNDNGDWVPEDGIILFQEQISELPFKEVHYQKTEGRWLGIGVVEDTFEAQMQINRIKDSEAKALELASLIVFQTKDETATRNIMSDTENGDIIRAKSEINRLDNNNHALGQMQAAADSYEKLADRETFSYDVIRGEAPPSSATATSVANQVTQASSVFDYKRENIGLFLQEFITDLVFPELEDKLNTAHVFRFSDGKDGLEKMRRRCAEAYVRAQIFETGFVPTADEYGVMVQQAIAKYKTIGDKLWLKVKKNFFKNLEYEVSLELTNEGKDIQSQLQNLSAVLTELAKNPSLLDNPVLKRLLFKQMALMGMSVTELENAESEMAQQTPEQLAQEQQLTAQRNLGGAAADMMGKPPMMPTQ